MRVTGGGEIAPCEVTALSFEADGELEATLNEAYIKLLEFAHDRDVRAGDGARDAAARAELDGILHRLVALTST
jgi:hypothetical protein